MSNFHPGESFQNGLTRTFDFIPQIIGAIIILIIGYIVAKILQNVVRRILRRLRFDRAMHTSQGGKYVARIVESPTSFVGKVTFWLVMLAFISFAVSTLNLPILNHILNGVYSYLPRVIAAVLIFLAASAISVGSAAFVQRVMGRTPFAKLVASVIPAITMSIAAFMILNQLNIARDIVNITYAALMGSVALGLALAFGLGGRDVARQMLEQAYESGRRNVGTAKQEISQAKDNVKREASRRTNNT
jgi:small-conductance mechanosensitive channel